jgi:hypothetical protein
MLVSSSSLSRIALAATFSKRTPMSPGAGHREERDECDALLAARLRLGQVLRPECRRCPDAVSARHRELGQRAEVLCD